MRTPVSRCSLLAQTHAYARAYYTQEPRSWLLQRGELKRGCCAVASPARDEKGEKYVWWRSRKRENYVPRKSSIVLGFAYAWLALAGRKAIPWLFTSFCDFEPPQHVPSTLARGPHLQPVLKRASCVPRNREQEKRPAGIREKNDNAPTKFMFYMARYTIVYCICLCSPYQGTNCLSHLRGGHDTSFVFFMNLLITLFASVSFVLLSVIALSTLLTALQCSICVVVL